MGRRRKSLFKMKLKPATVHSIAGVVLITFGVLLLISFAGKGSVLAELNSTLTRTFGLAIFFIPFIAISSGLLFFRVKQEWTKPHVLLGAFLMMIGTLGLLRTGTVGDALSSNLAQLLSRAGVVVISIALLLTGTLISLQANVPQVFSWMQAVFKPLTKLKPKSKSSTGDQDQLPQDQLPAKSQSSWRLPRLGLTHKEASEPESPGFTVGGIGTENSATPTSPTALANSNAKPSPPPPLMPHLSLEQKLKGKPASSEIVGAVPQVWTPPPLELLEKNGGGEADRGDVNANADMIESTLESFGIRSVVKQVNYGPSVTQFALEPARGTKLSKIVNLSNDLALALAAPTGQIRIEAPIPGQSLVGIELPNRSAQYVTLKTMMQSSEMVDNPSKLAVALGLDVSGKPVVMDIAKMPHVLIAGATGSGKSVAINSFMCSILLRASPQEVKFILVDPKRVELTNYNDLPHLLTPVIFESRKAGSALKWAVHEMEQRYRQLEQAKVKQIQSYNELAGFSSMYSIVIVVDELADVMLDAPAEVEESITRIAQKARAVGIHLVLATQRPSVDVLTGLIKANVPARIAFNVSSMMDSRVILDTPGAEKLLGKGDMLFIPPDRAKPLRIQGSFVTEDEAKRIVNYIRNQGLEPSYVDEITSKYKLSGGGRSAGGGVDENGNEEKDDMYYEVAKFLATQDRASTSMVQRRFRLGYNRAANIIDQMYSEGLVGAPDGSKSRTVNNARLMEVVRSVVGTGEE